MNRVEEQLIGFLSKRFPSQVFYEYRTLFYPDVDKLLGGNEVVTPLVVIKVAQVSCTRNEPLFARY